jgi:hypothetical protein
VEGDAAGMEDREDGNNIDRSVSDYILDIQAGHRSHIAGIVYIRELQQLTFRIAQQQMKFQRIS